MTFNHILLSIGTMSISLEYASIKANMYTLMKAQSFTLEQSYITRITVNFQVLWWSSKISHALRMKFPPFPLPLFRSRACALGKVMGREKWHGRSIVKAHGCAADGGHWCWWCNVTSPDTCGSSCCVRLLRLMTLMMWWCGSTWCHDDVGWNLHLSQQNMEKAK